MRATLPPRARRVLDRGALCYVAVATPAGPHLTPVVYVADGGHLWVTTSRRSVKARAWRRDPAVSGLVVWEGWAVSFRGRVRTYDALDPLTWPAAAVAGPRLLRAAARFGLKNARFFAGYAVDAGRVPLTWTPPGRVFARIDPEEGWVLDLGEGGAVTGWGARTPGGARYRTAFTALRPGRPLDLRAPAAVRRAVGASGPAALALQTGRGITVLPAVRRRVAREGAYDVAVPRRFLDLAGVEEEAPSALAMDHASAWRASAMSGILVQGVARAYAPGDTARGRRLLARLEEAVGRATAGGVGRFALVRLRPARVVWWAGWDSGSARAAGRGGVA